MGKRLGAVLFLGLVLTGLAYWQLPAILRLIPSRYVFAYVPEVVQDMARRDQPARLPTAAAPVAFERLLDLAPAAAASSGPTATPLPRPPIATATAAASATATYTPTPSPTPTATPIPFPPAARMSGFVHQFQGWNNCGPTTLAMALSFYGLYLNQNQPAAFLKPSSEDRNVSPGEMAAYVNEETPYLALDRASGDLDLLRRLVANEIPVIVEVGIDPPGEYAWMEWYGHYLLVVAYDDAQSQVWTYDSWFGTSEVPGENASVEGRIVSYEKLDRYWRQFNRNFIALYRPEQAELLSELLGPAANDDQMWQLALTRVQAELSAEPQNGFLWFNLGTVYNALGDFERAATAFDRAREIGLPWRMLWYQFGPYEAYLRIGRYDDVILLADATTRDRPYHEEAFYYKGLALAAQGNVEEARDSLRRAVNFNPRLQAAVTALEQLSVGN